MIVKETAKLENVRIPRRSSWASAHSWGVRASVATVTDATGTHYLQLDFNGETPDLPLTVSANASGISDGPVHPASEPLSK